MSKLKRKPPGNRQELIREINQSLTILAAITDIDAEKLDCDWLSEQMLGARYQEFAEDFTSAYQEGNHDVARGLLEDQLDTMDSTNALFDFVESLEGDSSETSLFMRLYSWYREYTPRFDFLFKTNNFDEKPMLHLSELPTIIRKVIEMEFGADLHGSSR